MRVELFVALLLVTGFASFTQEGKSAQQAAKGKPNVGEQAASGDFFMTGADKIPSTQFLSTDVVRIVFRNNERTPLICVVGPQPELWPNESLRLERFVGNQWISAQRPFENATGYKQEIQPGQEIVRLWPAHWSEPGRYRAVMACGKKTAVTSFEIAVSRK